jgi:hypothetical protein
VDSPVVKHIACNDMGAFGGEEVRFGEPLSTSCTSDKNNLALKPTSHFIPIHCVFQTLLR